MRWRWQLLLCALLLSAGVGSSDPVAAQERLKEFNLDPVGARAAGQASITATRFDIGGVGEIFDGQTRTLARTAAEQAGLPLVPGSAALRDIDDARLAAQHLGYPVLLKAIEGGGGVGTTLVANEEALLASFAQAQDRAARTFGASTLYMERLLEGARHVARDDAHEGPNRLGALQRRGVRLLDVVAELLEGARRAPHDLGTPGIQRDPLARRAREEPDP